MGKVQKPAIEGWFTYDGAAALIGTRCRTCNTFFFPKEAHFCRNPACQGTSFAEVQLSRSGTLWSYTNNCYAPPPPYVAKDPFRPYALAAVELDQEKMVVLGQVARGFSTVDLAVGMPMELVVEPLYEDEQTEYLVWKWKPAGRSAS
ncbi:MAG TPA: OB-fold domain-containing protein [Polyangiaceae bacterium]|nr:OB-fold domain-containing protein [Polyangiaceae bacterium]